MNTLSIDHIDAFGITDQGISREKNEDAIYVSDGLYAVADGLGGLSDGDIASKMAIDLIKDYHLKHKNTWLDFKTIFSHINNAIHQKNQKHDSLGMGTTLTAGYIHEKTLYIGHTGDSGVFLVRKNKLYRLTPQHTLAEQILNTLPQGQPIPLIPSFYYDTLTQCIGHGPDIDAYFGSKKLLDGDKLLFFTDGITKVMNEEDILDSILNTDSAYNLAHEMIRIANERGGPDNTTVIAVFIK